MAMNIEVTPPPLQSHQVVKGLVRLELKRYLYAPSNTNLNNFLNVVTGLVTTAYKKGKHDAKSS